MRLVAAVSCVCVFSTSPTARAIIRLVVDAVVGPSRMSTRQKLMIASWSPPSEGEWGLEVEVSRRA